MLDREGDDSRHTQQLARVETDDSLTGTSQAQEPGCLCFVLQHTSIVCVKLSQLSHNHC